MKTHIFPPYSTGVPYPPKNSIITFREPFFRKEFSGQSKIKYYIRACITQYSEMCKDGVGLPEREIRVAAKQQQEVMDYLLKTDLKLLGATVRNSAWGRFTVISHTRKAIFLM